MPWKVMYFLFIVLCFGIFAVFNMKNVSDVNLLFWQFKDIPIYISNLFSFLIGIIIILPFFVGSKKKKVNSKKSKIIQVESEAAGIKTVNLKDSKKKWFWSKKETSEKKQSPLSDENKSNK